MARVICHTYGFGIFNDVEFVETTVGGVRVGVATVGDAAKLKWFESREQFTVEHADDPPPPPAGTEPQGAPPLGDLTVQQLKDLAAESGIDLGEATRKADITAVIQAAQAAATAPESQE